MALADTYLDLSIWVWAGGLAAAGAGVLGVYFSDTAEQWTLIPAYVLFAIAAMLALIGLNVLVDAYVATFVLVVIALPFLYVYLRDRTQWWPLIPAYVLLAIGLMLLLVEVEILQDAFVATYVLSSIALPFVIVYLLDRANWWALIPAYVMLSVGFMVGLIDARVLDDLLIPAYVMFSIALPFLIVYLRNPKEWWPLIPGGVMGLIGMAFLLTERSTRIVAPILVIAVGVLIIIRQFMRQAPTEE
jgi:hypothetical protein